jgi:predicted dehydrogenase
MRIATVGLGFGAAVHVPAVLALGDAEFVGLAGRSHDKAARKLEELGLDRALAAASVDELLERRPDIVTVALPPDQNEAVVVRALQAGCAVLCEKPLAIDAAAAARMAAAAGDVPTAVDFQFAELGVFKQLAQLLADQRLGALRHVSVTWLVESFAQKRRLWSWKSELSAGGGVMSLLGSHLLFLAEHLFGPVAEVSAVYSNAATQKFAPTPQSAAEDLVQLRLAHVSGVHLFATIGNACPGLHRHIWHVVGDHGSVVVDNEGSDYMKGFSLRGAGDMEGLSWTDRDQPAKLGEERLSAFLDLLARFVGHIRSRDRSRFVPDFKAGSRVQQLMDAAARSTAAGGGSIACVVR